jgi:hypothetical protein
MASPGQMATHCSQPKTIVADVFRQAADVIILYDDNNALLRADRGAGIARDLLSTVKHREDTFLLVRNILR